MITERQRETLHLLIKEYLNSAEPVSSDILKKKCRLAVSPATIRNDLQALTDEGYLTQPHTSAGRLPTEKGYRYFLEITFSGANAQLPDFIYKEIGEAREKIEKELDLARELIKSFHEMSSLLDFDTAEKDIVLDILKVIGPSKNAYNKNIDLMKELLKEFEKL